jgi:hypothetical protein
MAFDNPAFGRENYEEYLRVARETLGVKYLTGGDREIIERGIYYLIRGDDLLKCEDPESLREAAWLFLAGGYYLGSRGPVSESEREYWRRESCAAGGLGEKKKRREKRLAKEAWVNFMRECVAKNPETSCVSLAESMQADKSAPKSLPTSLDYLTKQVRKTRTQLGSDKKGPRLVHSA